jgi:hypothetical protein
VAGSVVEEVDRQAGGPDRALGRSGKVAPDHAGHGRFYGHCNNWSRCTPPACVRPRGTSEPRGGKVDCDSRRDVGPTKTMRGVFMTQLNRLERLAVLSALREWPFHV